MAWRFSANPPVVGRIRHQHPTNADAETAGGWLGGRVPLPHWAARSSGIATASGT